MLESDNAKLKNYYWKGSSWSYKEGLNFQEDLINKYKSTPYFIASEHESVFSVGKSLKVSEKSVNNIPIVPVERGGKAMFHGPGQLTVYPIIKITDYFKGPRDYVCFLFKSLREYFLDEYETSLVIYDNGLWTVDKENKPLKKVIFLGLRIKKGVSYHGFSINYFCELKNFSVLSPCNISGNQVGNILKKPLSLEKEAEKIVNYLMSHLKKRN